MGPNPISYPDIAAWSLLTGRTVRPSEVQAITQLDALWRDEAAKPKAAASSRPD